MSLLLLLLPCSDRPGAGRDRPSPAPSFDVSLTGLTVSTELTSIRPQCDRVKPCHACCAHGYPSKCVYEDAPDEEARPISQAEEIRNLRAEIQDLRARVHETKEGSGCPVGFPIFWSFR